MRRKTRSVLSKGTGKVTSARLSKTDASGRLILPTAQPLLQGSSVCYLSEISWKPHRSLEPRVFRLGLHLPCSCPGSPSSAHKQRPPTHQWPKPKPWGSSRSWCHRVISEPLALATLFSASAHPAIWVHFRKVIRSQHSGSHGPELPTHLPSTHSVLAALHTNLALAIPAALVHTSSKFHMAAPPPGPSSDTTASESPSPRKWPQPPNPLRSLGQHVISGVFHSFV